MTDAFDYDLFVIGAGSGGVRAARVAAGHGAKVAVAEEYRIGGTCVIRGCVPKKLLTYGAHFAHRLGAAAHYGWTIEAARFDWAHLRDTVQAEVDRLNGLYIETLDRHGVTRLATRATVTGPQAVRLDDGRAISARHILVATGATPLLPRFPGAEHAISSNEVFHLPTFPRRLVIQGAGYIAMEFAGIFNALGAEVTVVNRSDRVLRGYDEALTERLLAITRARGISYRFNAPIDRIEKADDGALLVHTAGNTTDDAGNNAGDNAGDAAAPLACDAVLIATGRRPNTAGLGLETAGIALAPDGAVPVTGVASRTICPSIHAVGDVTGRVQLTPVAIREGQAFADAVFGGKDVVASTAPVPSAVFSQPPLAAVGLTEAEARAAGHAIRIYTADFRPMADVFAAAPERGLFKLVVAAESERVLGVHMIGPEAPEILQAIAIAVTAGLTKRDFDATIALHPTLAEELVLMR